MAEAADIRDKASLSAWLVWRSEEEAVWIAQRAAARVLPVWWDFALRSDHPDVTGLVVLRALLIAGERVRHTSPEIRAAAFAAAATAADAYAATAATAANAYAATAATAARAAATAAGTAYAAANAAYDAAAAAANANAAAVAAGADAATAAVWTEIRGDGLALQETGIVPRALWAEGPDPLDDLRRDVIAGIPKGAGHADYHSFWLRWYEDLYTGKPSRFPPALLNAIALIRHKDPDDWAKGDVHINNVVIPDLMDEHMPGWQDIARAEFEPTALAQAYPISFSFDAMAKVMRIIGVEDDNAHLHHPAIVQAFVDDAEEVRDALQDFADYAQALSGACNYVGVLQLGAEKILKEFTRVEDQTHLRARRLVRLAGDLEVFSQVEEARADLKGPLCNKLDDVLGDLKSLCRKHFGPSYLALAPLAELSLEHVDQEGVLALFDGIIARLQAGTQSDVVDLDAEGQAVLSNMLRELHDSRALLAAATSDEIRPILEDRFAQNSGALGLALNRYAEQSFAALGTIHTTGKRAVDAQRTVKGLADIMEAVGITFGSGGAP